MFNRPRDALRFFDAIDGTVARACDPESSVAPPNAPGPPLRETSPQPTAGIRLWRNECLETLAQRPSRSLQLVGRQLGEQRRCGVGLHAAFAQCSGLSKATSSSPPLGIFPATPHTFWLHCTK